ncbi:MAG: hypothetical protein ACXIU7_12375 [Roseinatronobacter sp.]
MRARILALPAALALAACVEVDMTIEVLGADEARLTGVMQMQRQIYDMAGGNSEFCDPADGGTLVLSETSARCTFDRTGSFAEILPSGLSDDTAEGFEGELVYLGDNRVRALLPLSGMGQDMDELGEDPMMLAMMRQMFAGMQISFTVKAREIEMTTGTLSDDGTAATIQLGVDELIVPGGVSLPDFETIARF